jgi:hypothetical protein
MSKRDTKRLTEAVNLLIQSDKYVMLIREITEIVERWDTHPMAYDGHLSCLNALIEIGLESRVAFENVIKLIETRRKAIPAIKRVDYQRTLMQERRARLAKALELHERSGKAIKNSAERATLGLQIQKRWAKAKTQFIKEKGKLSWKERNAVMTEFWAEIDATLDENLRAKRKETA